MYTPVIDFGKYNKISEQTFFKKLGKVANVVGLTIEHPGRMQGWATFAGYSLTEKICRRSWRRSLALRIKKLC